MENLNNNRIFIILGVAAVLLVLLFLWLLVGRGPGGDGGDSADDVRSEEGVAGEAVDVVSDFYSDWLRAAQSTSTDPYESGLTSAAVLSSDMRARLEEAKDEEVDPVTCQTSVPDRIGTKPIFVNETDAQFLVLPRGENISGQAIVTIAMGQVGWLITDITCSQGESAPEREFSFEREGFILKSVPPPLNPEYWHLVFEQDGVLGHTVPLFFDGESTCISLDDSESTCNPDSFTEAKKAFVQGEMTEAGLNVKRLKILE